MTISESAGGANCQMCFLKHEGECGVFRLCLVLVAYIILYCKGLTKWNLGDTIVRLPRLSACQARDTFDGDVVMDRAVCEEFIYGLKYATAAYKKDPKTWKRLQLDFKQHVKKAAPNQPVYFIAVDHPRQSIVWSIRGTFRLGDMLTDLVPYTEPFLHGAAQEGMLKAAQSLLEKEKALLGKLLADYPGYKVLVVGHSLGGAVASLLTILIHQAGRTLLGKFPLSSVKCLGYGSAACVDQSLAKDPRYNIHNIILQDDVVPRLTPASIEVLKEEMRQASLDQRLKDGTGTKLLKKLGGVVDKCVTKTTVVAGTVVIAIIKKVLGIQIPEIPEIPEVSWNQESLKIRRLYVPGNLYHIQRRALNIERRPSGLPDLCRPMDKWEEAPRDSKYNYRLVAGTVLNQGFRKIIVSPSALPDHAYFNYRYALVQAKCALAANP